MSDDDRCSIASEFGQNLVYFVLALEIDLAGRFVQNQDFWIAKDGSSQRKPFKMAALASSVDRALSVSSTRNKNLPP